MIGWLALLAVQGAWAAAGCEAPTTMADLQAPLADGESGVVELEEDAVTLAITRLDTRLHCLSEPLAPVDVAAVHRLYAYGAFVQGDIPGARAAFGAARGADPSWVITERLAPPGTPLRELFNTASLDVATEAVRVPSGTSLLVDGVRTLERPLDRPAVLQLISAEGHVLESAWLTEDEPMPDWSRYAVVVPPTPVAGAPVRGARERSTVEHGSPAPWWIAGGAAILAGAGVYAWALGDHAHYENMDNGLDEAGLSSLRGRANTKVAVSCGLGAVGLGLGVVAIRW